MKITSLAPEVLGGLNATKIKKGDLVQSCPA